MFDALMNFLQGPQISLWGPFLILVCCGLGLPVPEDVVLLVAGALAAVEERSWLEVSMVMYAAVIGGDGLIFLGGRYFGSRMLDSRLGQELISVERQERVQRFYARHGAKSLFLARFLPGLRSLIFFSAGSLGVNWSTFLLLDGSAALISVPVFVWVGHWLWLRFGNDVAKLNMALDEVHAWSLWLVVGALLVVGLLFLIGRWQTRRQRERKSSGRQP